MNRGSFARRANCKTAQRRDPRPEMIGIKPDPLASFAVERASELFIREIAEAQSSLAEYERCGLDPVECADFFSHLRNPPTSPMPSVDAKGYALVVLMQDASPGQVGGVYIFYTRRSRVLAIWTLDSRLRFVRTVKSYPLAARQSIPVRKARAAFAHALRKARAFDNAAMKAAARHG
jgi:hypothetical protein